MLYYFGLNHLMPLPPPSLSLAVAPSKTYSTFITSLTYSGNQIGNYKKFFK